MLVAVAVTLIVALPGAAATAPGDPRSTTSFAPLEAVREVLVSAVEMTVAAAEGQSAIGDIARIAAEPGSPLPACEYKDDLTRYSAVQHWRITLLDTNLRIKRSYKPWGLVSVSRAGIAGSGKVRKLVIRDLRAMAGAARRAGKPLAVRSAYRSYKTQVATFDSWVARSGYQQALKFSARPGHSEHQLGTTIDFTVAPGQPLSRRFGDTPQGRWLNKHGWKFGFVKSYPKGKRKVSCYGFEPWHWRYVGRDMARKIHDSGLVPRRYLWRYHETAP